MSVDFSIIVPLYNKEKEVERALASIFRQTLQSFEVIVVDDGSTDGGATLVKALNDPRLRLLQQSNQGVSASRNNGIERANAEMVVFLDADDEWLPVHLETLSGLAGRHPDAGTFFTAFWIDRGRNVRRRIRLPKKSLYPGTGLIADYFSIPSGRLLPSASAMKKSVLEASGGYREMFGEDVDLWLRVAAMRPVAYSSTATSIWHLDAGSRRCVEQTAGTKLYKSGSLSQSLAFILSTPAVQHANKEGARRYVSMRERKAIVDTILKGQRHHARGLYKLWCRQYEQRSQQITLLLQLPDIVLSVIAKGLSIFRRIASFLAYAKDVRVNVLVFGRASSKGKRNSTEWPVRSI